MSLWFDPGTGWEKYRAARLDHASEAFLCCPGPSLATVDRELRGPNRIIYALNTAYPKIKPDVWIGTDRIACFDRGLWHEPFPKICRRIQGDTERMRFCPNVFFADVDDCDPANIFLRRDHDAKFVWPHNTFIFALHFIIWSGAKTIRLVGCDMGGCGADGQSRDYHDDRQLPEKLRKSNQALYRRAHPRPRAPRAPSPRATVSPWPVPRRGARSMNFSPMSHSGRPWTRATPPSPRGARLLHSEEADDAAQKLVAV